MHGNNGQIETRSPSVEFHLLGRLEFDDCLALQHRLVYDAASRADGRLDVLMCEHASLITVGRSGSRAHIRLNGEQLRRRQLEVRWVNRSGGCVLHAAGQLAVYPIVPLRAHGWTIGEFAMRLHGAIRSTFDDLRIRVEVHEGSLGLWGRSGLVAAICVGVRDGITCHGAFINVNPRMTDFGFVDVVPAKSRQPGMKTTMGCLLAERRRPVRMPEVRAALIANLAAAFECPRYHLHTGHPYLRQTRESSDKLSARAS